jgi:hypothetical protein
VPLPLKIFEPYRTRAASPVGEATAWFELGFFLAPDPTVAKSAGNYLVVYPFPIARQLVLRAGPLGKFAVSAERP